MVAYELVPEDEDVERVVIERMALKWDRFKDLPNILKLTTFITTIAAIIVIGAASYQPGGTGFVWMTLILSLIVQVFLILIFAFEIEHLIVPKRTTKITWPIIETGISLLFSVLYFISVFLCIHGTTYESTIAFTFGGFFCLSNFIQYGFNMFLYIRIFMLEQRRSEEMTADPLDPVLQNPILIKSVCLILSIINLLCIAAAKPVFGVGISLFIGIFSLAISCITIGLVASDLHKMIAEHKIWRRIKPTGNVSWADIQYTYALILSSFNFIGIIINSSLATEEEVGRPYGVAAFFSFLLFITFLVEALIALYDDTTEDGERDSLRPSNYSEV